MWGRRCDIGCESWPDDDIYGFCPQCGEPTERFSNLRPLDEDEAESLRKHFAFNERYEAYCAGKKQPVEGPLEPTKAQHEKYDALYPGGRPDNPHGSDPQPAPAAT